MNFSEAMSYENYLTSDFHTNTVISRRVSLLVKMASKTVIRPDWTAEYIFTAKATAKQFQPIHDHLNPRMDLRRKIGLNVFPLWTKKTKLLTKNTFFEIIIVIEPSPRQPSLETRGQIVGPKTKIKTGWKKFDDQKYERKIRAPRIFLSYFCSSNFFPPVLIFVFGPTICPWVSKDARQQTAVIFPRFLPSLNPFTSSSCHGWSSALRKDSLLWKLHCREVTEFEKVRDSFLYLHASSYGCNGKSGKPFAFSGNFSL